MAEGMRDTARCRRNDRGYRQAVGCMNRGQCYDRSDRPWTSGKHYERGKRRWSSGVVIRWRFLANRLTTPQHVKSHIGDDHPTDDPKYVQRNVENA